MISKRAHGLECHAFSNAVFRKMTAAPKTTKGARSGRPKCSKCAVQLRKISIKVVVVNVRDKKRSQTSGTLSSTMG